MIIGAHGLIYSMDAAADRVFVRDVLGLPYVDDGDGWLIFALPPSELAFHGHDRNDLHEIYFMCDDIDAFVNLMKEKGVSTSPVHEEDWGLLTQVTLPGGGKLGVYEPRHSRPDPFSS